MLYVLKFHALMAILSLVVIWGRAALSFQGRDDVASGKAALIASVGTMGLMLISAVILMFGTGQYPFNDVWLTEKLIWLGAYVVFSVASLVPKLPNSLRIIMFGLSTVAFAFAYSVARHHVGIFM